jgi:hypothetical protein
MSASVPRRIASGIPVELIVAAAGACLAALALTACDRSPQTTSTASSPSPTARPDPAAAQAARAAQTQAAQSWEPSALDDLLAPIALYPDALVGQILAASTNAQEVLDAGNWLLDNQDLKGAELDAATEKLGFGPAVRSLVHFPDVVDMMCSQLDWTREVGQAFTADQRGVLDSIQRLRSQAAAVGNLKSTPQQKVEEKEESGKQVIVVEPADPKVVYVPQYNPQVVYTTPPPAPATTTVVQEGHDTGDMVAAGLIGFTAGIILNEAFDDHDDYYYPHWGGGPVYYPPPYRPVYPGYRPAGAYTRPVNYRHSYNNINGDVNINVGNDDYFNRVTHNQRAVNRKTTDPDEWRGQSSYRGSQAGRQDRSMDRVSVPAAQDRARTDDYRRAADARGADQRPRTDAYRGSDEHREKRLNDQPGAGEYRGASRDAAERVAGGNTQRDGERLSTGAPRDVERHVGGTGASTRQPRADRGFDSGAAASSGAASVSRQGATGSGALSNVSRGSREHAASQRGHQSAGNRARRGR